MTISPLPPHLPPRVLTPTCVIPHSPNPPTPLHLNPPSLPSLLTEKGRCRGGRVRGCWHSRSELLKGPSPGGVVFAPVSLLLGWEGGGHPSWGLEGWRVGEQADCEAGSMFPYPGPVTPLWPPPLPTWPHPTSPLKWSTPLAD